MSEEQPAQRKLQGERDAELQLAERPRPRLEPAFNSVAFYSENLHEKLTLIVDFQRLSSVCMFLSERKKKKKTSRFVV